MLPFQELETRIETQKQTLQARDDSIKKLLEMLQSKGDGELNPFFLLMQFFTSLLLGKEEEARVHQHMHAVAQRQVSFQSIQFIILSMIYYYGYDLDQFEQASNHICW